MRSSLKMPCRTAMAVLAAALMLATSMAQASWTTWNSSFEGGTLKVLYPSALANDQARIGWMIEMADRSTKTTNPLGNNPDGLIEPGDIVVCSNSMLMWFDVTSAGGVTTNGGGGLLRGLWTIHRDGSNNLNFERIVNAYNYAPNLMFAGSNPSVEGSGHSVLGNYGETNVDNGVSWAVEHDENASITAVTGASITSGPYYDRDGVYVQVHGYVANSNVSAQTLASMGLDSHYDVDNRLGYEGRALFTVTYRVPATGEDFGMACSFYVTQNNFGALATVVFSNNMAGYDGQAVKQVADPELNGDYITSDATDYFTLSGYDLAFYNMAWSDHDSVRWADTPLGEATLVGMGLPQITYPVPFYEFRPDPNYIPAYAQSRYSLMAIDNQSATAGYRCNALDMQYWDVNKGHTGQTLSQGSYFYIVNDIALH